MPRIEEVSDLDDGSRTYPVITGDYSGVRAWRRTPVAVGASVAKPTLVFTKFDPRSSTRNSPAWHNAYGTRLALFLTVLATSHIGTCGIAAQSGSHGSSSASISVSSTGPGLHRPVRDTSRVARYSTPGSPEAP